MSVLPRELNFNEIPPVLDSSVRSTTINITPSNNKSSYTTGDYIDFDFPKQGFVDGKSLYLSYNCGFTVATAAVTMFTTPFSTPINRVEESSKSGTLMLNTVPQYNILYNDLVQLQYSVADKYGNQYGLGYVSQDQTNPTFDGRYNAVGAQKFFLSAPLYGLIMSNSEKLISMEHLGGYRIRLYIENSLSNIFDTPANVSAFVLSNFQLTCDVIDTSAEIANALRSQPYIIKSSTYAVASQPVPASSNGTLQLSYANNFSSLKHVIIHPNDSSTVNKFFDAVDITTTNANATSASAPLGGSYGLSIGNISFPQSQLNTGTNKAQVYQELKKAVGLLYGTNNLSINRVEFNYGSGATTTVTEPGKFLLAVDTTRISANSRNLLNGISTKNTPINCIINMQTANVAACSVYLLMCYDVLLNIDPINNQVSLSV